MGNKFFAKSKDKDEDDDLLEKQLTVLEKKGEKADKEEDEIEVPFYVKPTEPAKKDPAPEIIIDKKSVIQEDMIITGTVTATSPLLINGTINGNVDCKNEVTVIGKIKGNVNASALHVMKGKIVGDVNCSEGVNVLGDSYIHGNVTGNSLTCDGKVEGNTQVKGKAEIRENAVILGDVVCSSIEIKEGAVCKGNIQTGDKKPVIDITVKKDAVSKDKSVKSDLKQYI